MKRLKTKLVVVYTVALVIFISFLLMYINHHIHSAFITFQEAELQHNIENIHIYLRSYHKPFNYVLFQNPDVVASLKNVSYKSSLRITIIKDDGTVYFDSFANPDLMENHLYRPEILQARTKGVGSAIRYSKTVKSDMLYVAKYFDNYYIRAAKSLGAINTLIGAITKNILIVGFGVLVLTIAANYIFATIFTKPIAESLQFIDQFFNGDLNARILNYKDDEIGYLQNSMNRLADNIQARINELTAQKNKLFMIIESIHDPIALIDDSKKITVYNKAFIELFQFPETVTNTYYFSIIRHSQLNAKIHVALSQRQNFSFEETIGNNHFQIFIYPFPQPDSGILLLMHDVTEQKRIQKLKSDLVGNLSHELKTPISIIRGYLETIKDISLDEKTASQFIDNALINLERQNAIINDMLKLNELETTAYAVTEYIDIKTIITRCIELLNPKIQRKNLAIVMDIDAIPETIAGNAFLTEEIFFNIIDNAINYNNPNGTITIKSAVDTATISISIADTGVGIPQDEIPRIFERFYRVDKSRSRDTGGTGLGLSIVKHAAQILGWNVSVTSSMNGTVFAITIPWIR